jgi:hypothetical protein
MTYDFVFKDSFLDLTKTQIREIQTDEEVLLHPKWSFPIGKFSFFSGTEEYKAISTKENLIYNAFVVFHPDGHEIVRVKDISLQQKKSIFKELHMNYQQNCYHITSTFAYKTITIRNGEEVILTAYKISSVLKNILGIYDYKVHVHHTIDLPFVVWVAVFKGIHLLLRH